MKLFRQNSFGYVLTGHLLTPVLGKHEDLNALAVVNFKQR